MFRSAWLLLFLVLTFAQQQDCTKDCDYPTDQETEEQKRERYFERKHSEPLNGLSVLIYNMRKDYEYYRLSQWYADWDGLKVHNQKNKAGDMWELEEEGYKNGVYWLINAQEGDRLEMHPDKQAGTENESINSDQHWLIQQKYQKGGYLIVNKNQNAALCMTDSKDVQGWEINSDSSDDDFLCLAKEETSRVGTETREDTIEGCKNRFRGTGKGFVYFHQSDSCTEAGPRNPNSNGNGQVCYDLSHSDNTFGSGCLWRMENMWESEAMWRTITILNNQINQPTTYTYTTTQGYSSSVSRSKSHEFHAEMSMEVSGEKAIKGGLGPKVSASFAASAGMQFASSVDRSYEEHQEVEKSHETIVDPNTCMHISQLIVSQRDVLGITTEAAGPGNLPQFTGTTDTIWIKQCGDDTPFSDDSETAGPGTYVGPVLPATQSASSQSASSQSSAEKKSPLHTLDQEYHMKETDTDLVWNKEETWSKKERREKEEAGIFMTTATSTNDQLVVYGFAAVGLAFLLYGAGKHYLSKDTEHYSKV